MFFSLLLIGTFTFVLLDTFVIPKPFTEVTEKQGTIITESNQTKSQTLMEAELTDTSYEDENIKIDIETIRKFDTTIYVADVQISDASYLKTALAEDTFGRNIKDTTSDIAESNNAILAINGDYYGFRNTGYVLRNGTLYRDTASQDGGVEDLIIDSNGDFSILTESQISTEALKMDDMWQILSFGPALIEEGQLAVDSSSEVSKSKGSNPRTAIGQISELHYIIIVSDGRTGDSEGLSLLELAQEFMERGCSTAYNLDGGGSSTMYFNGEIVNNPTDGRNQGEREVSDIVYIGY